jgi:hypothetical protein
MVYGGKTWYVCLPGYQYVDGCCLEPIWLEPIDPSFYASTDHFVRSSAARKAESSFRTTSLVTINQGLGNRCLDVKRRGLQHDACLVLQDTLSGEDGIGYYNLVPATTCCIDSDTTSRDAGFNVSNELRYRHNPVRGTARARRPITAAAMPMFCRWPGRCRLVSQLHEFDMILTWRPGRHTACLMMKP